MFKKLFYILFLLGYVGFSQENPVSFSASTNKIKIGEQIEYKIVVKSKNKVGFPSFILDSLRKVEVVEALPIDTLKNRYEKTYLLTSFDSGQFVIPEQRIVIGDELYNTKSFLIEVSHVAVDTLKQKMYEIKAIKSEPKTFDDYKHIVWWLLAILAIIGAILYFIFRKKKEKEVVVYVAPIQEAYQRLKELDEKQLLQQNKVKIYYSELTDIVRTYIEKDIKIPALESTTNELIETIIDFNESSKLGISKDTIQQLKTVLQSADLVKFAKSKPLIEEIKSDRNSIEEILRNTQLAVHRDDAIEEKQPEGSVETFVAEAPKKKKAINLKRALIIGSTALVTGLIVYIGFGVVKNYLGGTSTIKMMEKDWSTGTYGIPEVTLETPEKLEDAPINLPENVLAVVGNMSIYTYGNLVSDFYIGVTSTQFKNVLEAYDLDAGVEGSLKEMENSLGSMFSKKLHEPITINGVEGRKVIVEYDRKSLFSSSTTRYKLTMLFFADPKGLRQVIVSNLYDDEAANKICNRIINSVSINP